MPARADVRTILTGAIAGVIAFTAPALAQTAETKTDSAPHFALFTGPASFHGGFGLGGSGDFHLGNIPVPLRLSVAFSNENDRSSSYSYVDGNSSVYGYSYIAGERKAMASLELVMHPIPKKLGIQPYFLGGVGVGTRAGLRSGYSSYNNDGTYTSVGGYRPRETAAFFTFGMGLDIGRLFIEAKGASSIATNVPPAYNIVNVGFRLWD
jgi:hypothetical protein